MSRRFGRVAVVGLGLLGGSVALATKRRGVASRVVGATRQSAARERALRDGAVDEILPLEDVARDADLIVLATPVCAMVKTLEGLAPGLKEGAIVTDVGSVKSPLVETLPGLLPPGVSYVGSHPMAGSHERGMAHARADLFEGATCVVTEMENPGAVERVCEFWRSLGAVVAQRDAGTHDIEVAWVSHVPHVLAFAFARALESAPSGAMEVSGSGFRDFTRIARSDAELWGDILTENRKALGIPLQKASAALAELATAIESGDVETLERLLAVARETLSSMSPASLVGSETRKESQTPPSGPGAEGTGD